MLFIKSFAATVAGTAALVAALPSGESNPYFKRAPGFNFGSDVVRGVNIGGWLVLEPWITPSLFSQFDPSLGIVDEYTLTQKLGTDAAYNILKPHWDTWATLDDFKKIAASGFNTVRIPIGYWSFHSTGEPYTAGAAPYLNKAIDWARATGLKVWIDLHGAPGSQNGFDNSGHRLNGAKPGWEQGGTVRQTLDVLKFISLAYGGTNNQDVVVAIELLNEPLGPNIDEPTLRQFYRDGFFQTRDSTNTPVVIHDAFFNPSQWNGFLTPSDNNAQGVIVDHHEYQVFDNGLLYMTPAQHNAFVCQNAKNWAPCDKWHVVGEWTAAMTDCAPQLNGQGVGARYDGTFPGSTYVGSCAGKSDLGAWSAQMKSDTRSYIEAQLDVFEQHGNGWIFWNFKTSGAAEWDAFALIDAGIFPQPLTARQFPAASCNF